MSTHPYVYLNGGGYTPVYNGGGTNGNAPTPGPYSQQPTGTPSTPGPSQYIPPTIISNLGLFRSNMQVKYNWLLPKNSVEWILGPAVPVFACDTCETLCMISMWKFGYWLPSNCTWNIHSMHDTEEYVKGRFFFFFFMQSNLQAAMNFILCVQ
jgi:hypothetical protein